MTVSASLVSSLSKHVVPIPPLRVSIFEAANSGLSNGQRLSSSSVEYTIRRRLCLPFLKYGLLLPSVSANERCKSVQNQFVSFEYRAVPFDETPSAQARSTSLMFAQLRLKLLQHLGRFSTPVIYCFRPLCAITKRKKKKKKKIIRSNSRSRGVAEPCGYDFT